MQLSIWDVGYGVPPKLPLDVAEVQSGKVRARYKTGAVQGSQMNIDQRDAILDNARARLEINPPGDRRAPEDGL